MFLLAAMIARRNQTQNQGYSEVVIVYSISGVSQVIKTVEPNVRPKMGRLTIRSNTVQIRIRLNRKLHKGCL